jgi:hypothetical protein
MIREGDYRVVASSPAPDPWAWTAASAAYEPARRQPPRRPPPDTRPRRAVACEISTARRTGLCAVCGEAFEYGSDVAFPTLASDSNLGAVHADCRSRWTVPVDP